MRGQRYQDPKIQVRNDVARPFYWIRPYVPVVTESGIVRKQRSMALGFCDEISMREAKARKQQIMATVNAGKFLVQSQIPFSGILGKFIEVRLPQLGSATQEKYRNHIGNHIEPAFANLQMCDIDRPTVEAWLNEKTATGLAHWTLLDLRNLLSAIFSKAAEWKLWQGENPCARLKVGGAAEVREKSIPKPDGLNSFLEALGDTAIAPAEGARLMVLTAVTAGLRISEVLGLQPRDIDSRLGTVKVSRRWHRGNIDEPKSSASRRERQVGGLADELLQFAEGKQAAEYIFGRSDRNGDPPDDRDLQQHVFRPAAEAVGIYAPGFGMHTFRRLNITWRQEVGATPFEAQKAAGHAKPSTTWSYTIADRDREREQVARIRERLDSDKTGRPPLKFKHGVSTKEKRAS